MLNHTNLEDYADPATYDRENEQWEPEGPMYLALARQFGGPILELGCGTGRVTIPLAEQGFAITGLDLVPGMLARAQHKAGALAIDWVEANMRSFRLETRFPFIFATTGVFQHLLERRDQEAMLARAREHLAPGGSFVVDAHVPRPNQMRDSLAEQEWYTYDDGEGRTVHVSGSEHYDHIRQVRHETAVRRWRDDTGQLFAREARLALRYIFPQEMEALLHYNGFVVEQRYGDWDLSPLVNSSKTMIYICRHASPHA